MTSLGSTYRLTAFLLALLLLITSAGFAVDLHFCGGKLVSFSFWGKAKTCYELANMEEAPKVNCPGHSSTLEFSRPCLDAKSCCSNKTLHVQADQDRQTQNGVRLFSVQQMQPIAFVSTSRNRHSLSVVKKLAIDHYKPPKLPKDVAVAFQTFLF